MNACTCVQVKRLCFFFYLSAPLPRLRLVNFLLEKVLFLLWLLELVQSPEINELRGKRLCHSHWYKWCIFRVQNKKGFTQNQVIITPDQYLLFLVSFANGLHLLFQLVIVPRQRLLFVSQTVKSAFDILKFVLYLCDPGLRERREKVPLETTSGWEKRLFFPNRGHLL